MFYSKKLIISLTFLLLPFQIYSQVFPNSSQYKIAQQFFNNNPQKLEKLVNSIGLDSYGKCLAIVTTWDIAIIKGLADPSENVKLNFAVQYIGLEKARKKLISQGVSDDILNDYVKSYRNRIDVGNGDVNFNKWNKECAIIGQKGIND